MKEKDKLIIDESLTQRVIDPNTGRDITGEYINQRLKELEIVAEKIIEAALKEFKQDQSIKKKIYQNAYWEIHNKLGMGSIGPATAAAGPLMEKKKHKLAIVLEIDSNDLL
jgi:Ni,Fe-hydrogenase III large subunit